MLSAPGAPPKKKESRSRKPGKPWPKRLVDHSIQAPVTESTPTPEKFRNLCACPLDVPLNGWYDKTIKRS
nr:MAG TPA: hypothetical protein [Caudoviricetes sp.]